MNTDKLASMANRIGEFFAAYPDRDEALDGIADHLRHFWTPSMRAEFLGALDAGRLGTLSELVRDAVATHRAALLPAAREG